MRNIKKKLDTFLEINIFKGFGHILRPLLLLYYITRLGRNLFFDTFRLNYLLLFFFSPGFSTTSAVS